ncbi:MAG: ethanolamine utilization protein EutH [Clostridia bacterium]|nr:ethanolamine utilization protein EutH [Clostridia bacterium]
MLSILQSHLNPSQLIIDLMVVFMIVGAVDHLLGNRLGLGSQFLEGFAAFGSIAPTMAGILVLVPLIGRYIAPMITPLCEAAGIDSAIFAGAILACDMGGWQLACELAGSPAAAGLGGMLLGSMMGVNIVFNIPVALGIIDAADRPAMSKGILCGFLTIPVGCFFGGLTAGYEPSMLLINLLVPLGISVVIGLLLWFVPEVITRVFLIFGRIIGILATLAAVIAIASALTGLTIIPGLGSVYDALDVVIAVVILLPGAYVMVNVISRLLKKPFAKIGGVMGVNDQSTLGLVSTLANAVPTFHLIRGMDERGKVINFAFLVSAGYMLGDHLAFCSAMESALVPALLVGKATAGVTAILAALLLTRRKKSK